MFYKAVFNGSCKGQDIKNILYYRSGLGLDALGLTLAGTEALAGNLKQEVWPALKQWLTTDYVLETIDVSAINDEFQLVYQMPFSLPVGETGVEDRVLAGPALCANFKFNLEPTSIINGIKPPSRGYIAFGPMSPVYVEEDGFFSAETMASSRVTNIQAALSQNIEQLLPVTFVWFPIRLKQSRILGGLVHWESYADIKGCSLSRRASFRRSRMPEL